MHLPIKYNLFTNHVLIRNVTDLTERMDVSLISKLLETINYYIFTSRLLWYYDNIGFFDTQLKIWNSQDMNALNIIKSTQP